LGLSLRQR